MHGEVRQPGTLTPGHERYGSGLRDRSADLERVCTLITYSRAKHALARQPEGWKSPAGVGAPDSGPGVYFLVVHLRDYYHRVPAMAERLAIVSLECRPVLHVIAVHGGHRGLDVDRPVAPCRNPHLCQLRHETPRRA